MNRRFTRTPEDMIDTLLAKGDLVAGEAHLDEQLKHMPLSDSARHHLSLKKAALPLYEIAHGTDDELVYDEANDAYGCVGEQLAKELKRQPFDLGRLSEQTFFALHLREPIDQSTPTVMVPAPRNDDIHRGTDFYISPAGTGHIADGWAIQLKTREKPSDRKRYRGHIAIIGMLWLDPLAYDPRHKNSLANSVLRELNGLENRKDRRRLTIAREKTYEKVKDNPVVRATEKALFQTARRLDMLDKTQAGSPGISA